MAIAIGDRIDPPLGGSSTTNGLSGRSISFASSLPDTDYHITITPTVQAQGQFGELWYSKTTTGFTLYNDGAAGLGFTWSVQRY